MSDVGALEAINNPFEVDPGEMEDGRKEEEVEEEDDGQVDGLDDDDPDDDAFEEKPVWDRQMLRHALAQLGAFRGFPAPLIEFAVGAFTLEKKSYSDKQAIVRFGARLDRLFVVASGTVHLFGTRDTGMRDADGDIQLAALSRGGAFNAAALMHDIPSDQDGSRCRAVAHGQVRVYTLRRELFLSMPARELRWYHRMPLKDFVLTLPCVSPLRGRGWFGMDDRSIVEAVDDLTLRMGQRRFKTVRGVLEFLQDPQAGGSFAIVKSGALEMTLKVRRSETDSSLLDRKLVFGRGDVIAPDALEALASGRRNGTITAAIGDGAYLTLIRPLSPSAFTRASRLSVGGEMAMVGTTIPRSPLQQALTADINGQYLRKLLSSMEAFAQVATTEIDALISRSGRQNFASGEVILKAGTVGAGAMYVVYQGSARASRDANGLPQTLGYFNVGEQFGANALFSDAAASKPRAVTVTAETDLKCLVLSREHFGSLLDVVNMALKREVANRKWQLDTWGKIGLSDLRRTKILGEGSYGVVYKGVHKENGKLFAVKTVAKDKLKTTLTVRQANNERALMAACNHPFICKLGGSYQSKTDLYYVLELIEGGELFDKLDEEGGTFSLWASLFYTANVLAALSHLHRLKVCHRDVKTENLMLQRDGYLKLIDMGFAKHLANDRTRAISFCGTPHYMAPEILRFESHGTAVDVWALGALLYEMLFGSVPFERGEGTPQEVFHTVIDYSEGDSSLLSFPAFYRMQSAGQRHVAELITSMLAPSANERPTVLEAADHVALAAFPLLKVEQKAFEAPHPPATERFTSEADSDVPEHQPDGLSVAPSLSSSSFEQSDNMFVGFEIVTYSWVPKREAKPSAALVPQTPSDKGSRSMPRQKRLRHSMAK